MNVVFCSSNLYAKCTGVAIYSLLFNNKTLKNLEIYVITTDMFQENRNRIEKLCDDFGRKIHFIDGNEILNSAKKELNLLDFKGGLNTYARALANKFLPSSVDKALFLDSDLLINGNLVELEQLDMGENIICGVCEVSVLVDGVCYEDIELLNQCPNYINYGVALINLDNWRKYDGDKLIQKTVLESSKPFKVAEQSILNLAFNKYTLVLPLKYNFTTYVHDIGYENLCKRYRRRYVFSEKEYNDAVTQPIIVHFIGDYFNRPWYENNICRYKKLYEDYYKASPWSNEKYDVRPQDISLFFRIYYGILIFLRKNKFDGAYFYFRYVFVQWLREHISDMDGKIKRKKG